MKQLMCLFLLIMSGNLTLLSVDEPIKFVIVIPSFNNEKWCIENIESCVNQTYQNYSVIYVDDCSTDKTGQLIDNYVETHHLQDRVQVIHNKNRVGNPLGNFYKIIQALDPHWVVVNVDGDDKLMHPRVLEKLAEVYKNPNIWLTYGSMAPDNPHFDFVHCKPFPSDVIKNKSYRSYKWVSSHLRTYYAGLFQRIKKRDLLYHHKKFFPAAGDLALMFPMLEMASPNHFLYIHDVLYWYRTTNPLSEFRSKLALVNKCTNKIRAMKHYPSLHSLFPDDEKRTK
jgi:glycosyltransferase involved in cell wall biosynthesis